MTQATFAVPLSLILLGLSAAACGHAAGGEQAEASPNDDGGAGPVPGLRDKSRHLDLDLPSADGGQGGNAEVVTPPATSAPLTAAAPARTATPRPETTPPRVVSVQPANGAVGVAADAKLIIEFSEPMAQRATEDALASEGLLRAHLLPSWNEAGTILTFAPQAPLAYAHATITDGDPLELEAQTYRYTLTRDATDLSGNALPETSFQFSTLREVTQTLTPIAALTGARRDALVVGDEQPRLYGFLTFNVGLVPAGVVKLEQAVAVLGPNRLEQSVPVFEVGFDELSSAVLSAGSGTLVGTLPAGVSGALTIPPGVSSFLAQDYLNRTATDHLAQFRLDLPAAVANVDLDLVRRALEQTSLVVDYLVP